MTHAREEVLALAEALFGKSNLKAVMAALDEFGVGIVGKAFIVDHDIEATGPTGILIHTLLDILAPRASSAFLHHGPRDVGPGAHAFREDDLLLIVIVATSSSDQEGTQRLGRFRSAGGKTEQEDYGDAEGNSVFHLRFEARLARIIQIA